MLIQNTPETEDHDTKAKKCMPFNGVQFLNKTTIIIQICKYIVFSIIQNIIHFFQISYSVYVKLYTRMLFRNYL